MRCVVVVIAMAMAGKMAIADIPPTEDEEKSKKDCADGLCHCGTAKEKAVNATQAKLSKAKKAAQGVCGGKTKDDCTKEGTFEALKNLHCTFCEEDSHCYLIGDLTNKCHEKWVSKVVEAAEYSKDAVENAADEIAGYVNACSNKNNKTCVGKGNYLCRWCEASEKCHNLGSPMNQCTKNFIKKTALEPLKSLVNEAKNAASDQIKEWMDACEKLNSTDECGDNWECIWCGDSSDTANKDSEDFNKCYWLGDKGNACANEKLKSLIDGAKGTMKKIGDWAGNRYKDLKKWGNDICGKHTEDSPCDDDVKCTWCDTDKLCYIMASVNNPCGNFKKGKAKLKEFWNGMMGKKKQCSDAKVKTLASLTEAKDFAAKNLELACDTYFEDKLESQRFASVIKGQDKGLQGAELEKEEVLEEMFEHNVLEAQQKLKDAMLLDDEYSEQKDSLEAFLEINTECSHESLGAPMGTVLSASALVAMLVTACL